MPNVRKMFIPDPGYTILEADLQRADAQVVAWEADDEELKEMFRAGADIHTENAKAIYHTEKPTYEQRQKCKQGVHATNYGAGAKRLAEALGSTVAEAENFQLRWFGAHPKVKEWHERIQVQLYTTRTVQNAFGYKRFYFDRIDGLITEALAWIPQSTVGLTINHALAQICEGLPKAIAQRDIEPLLQVHDSLVIQVRTELLPNLLPKIHKLAQVTVPYPDPLIIPITMAKSAKSWGDIEEVHDLDEEAA